MRLQLVSVSIFASILLALSLLTGTAPASTALPNKVGVEPILVSGTEILHLKTDEYSTDPAGTVTSRWKSEFWYDPSNGDARYEQKEADGSLSLREARHGLSDSVFYPRENHVETQTVVVDPTVPDPDLPGFLNNVRNQVLGYKSVVLDGLSPQPVRDGEDVVVDALGQPHESIVVERPYLGDDESDIIKAWLDAKDLLPLKEITYRHGELGGLVEVSRHLITYTLIERFPRSRLPTNFFVLEGPSVETTTNQVYFSPTTAKEFREFPVYWVGPSAGVLPLTGIYQDEVIETSSRLSSFTVFYGGKPDISGSLTIRQRGSSPRPEERNNRYQPGRSDPGTPISVGGRSAALYDYGDSILLELTIDGTFITIEGDDRQQVLLVAETLQRLN